METLLIFPHVTEEVPEITGNKVICLGHGLQRGDWDPGM